MSRRLDEDDESILPQRPPRLNAEREVTLGTGAILAIFFGLVVLCGAFFGFGYKLGSSTARSAATAVPADAADLPTASSSTSLGALKPNAGSPVADASAGTAPGIAVRAGAAPVLTTPPGGAARVPQPAESFARSEDTPPAPQEPAFAHSAPAAAPPTSGAPLPATLPAGSFVVQVSAFTHPEDADIVLTALRAKGYSVAARSEPGDKLIHIQIGPFSNRKDADAMSQRLLADGYKAFVK